MIFTVQIKLTPRFEPGRRCTQGLFNFQASAFGKTLFQFGQGQTQNAVYILCLDFVGIHAGDVKHIKGTAEIGGIKNASSYRIIPVPEIIRPAAIALRNTEKLFMWKAGKKEKPFYHRGHASFNTSLSSPSGTQASGGNREILDYIYCGTHRLDTCRCGKLSIMSILILVQFWYEYFRKIFISESSSGNAKNQGKTNILAKKKS